MEHSRAPRGTLHPRPRASNKGRHNSAYSSNSKGTITYRWGITLDSGQIVLLWGFLLFVADNMRNGSFYHLWQIISQGAIGGSNPPMILVWAGEIVAIVILYMIAESSDDGAKMAMWFEAALSLIFVMVNLQLIQEWLGQIGL